MTNPTNITQKTILNPKQQADLLSQVADRMSNMVLPVHAAETILHLRGAIGIVIGSINETIAKAETNSKLAALAAVGASPNTEKCCEKSCEETMTDAAAA